MSGLSPLFVTNRWVQFQTYFYFAHGIELMLTGDVTGVSLGQYDRVSLSGTRKLRSSRNIWEQIPNREPFLVPGVPPRLSLGLTPGGRLYMFANHPREPSVTILFPERDTGEPEQLAGGPIVEMLRFDELKITPFQG